MGYTPTNPLSLELINPLNPLNPKPSTGHGARHTGILHELDKTSCSRLPPSFSRSGSSLSLTISAAAAATMIATIFAITIVAMIYCYCRRKLEYPASGHSMHCPSQGLRVLGLAVAEASGSAVPSCDIPSKSDLVRHTKWEHLPTPPPNDREASLESTSSS